MVEPLGEEEPRGIEVGGKEYQLIRSRYLLFPQRSGRISLPGPVYSGWQAYARGEALELQVRPGRGGARSETWLPARGLRLEERWSSWRNDSLAVWYGELASIVRRKEPTRKLIAAFLNTFSSRHASEPPRYDGVTTETLRNYLRGLGLESLLTGMRPGIQILRPVRLPAAGHKRSERASQVSRSPEAAALCR